MILKVSKRLNAGIWQVSNRRLDVCILYAPGTHGSQVCNVNVWSAGKTK